MYQGKFDNKHKKSDANVQELLSQRSSKPEKKKKSPAPAPAPEPAPAPSPAPTEETVPAVKQKKAAAKPEVTDVPVKKQEKKSKKKKSTRKGTAFFYTFYVMFILLFAAGSFLGLRWLEGWLTDYEAANVKCQEVFEELFADPDWGALYEQAGIEDSLFEGKDAYVAHMQSKVGAAQLTYLETSAGLSQGKKYVVRLGNEKIAAFTMEGEREYITDIPDWQLGEVELFLARNNTIRIQKMEGHTAYVNGVALDDSYTVQIAGTSAEDYLPIGMTGVRLCTQEVTGLMAEPVVTITDDTGANMDVTYDEASGCYVALTASNTISDEHRELALEAARTYCKWMIEEVNSRATIAKFFDPSSDTYRNIISVQNDRWIQEHNGYKFENESVIGYTMYGDNIFSVRVGLSLYVTHTDGTVKEYAFDQALFFNKKDSGSWLCYEMTDADISLPRGEVRLTFMEGDELLTTGFYDTGSTNLIAPVLSAPEGKVFAGWARKDVDADGRTTMTLVLQPDSEGKVLLPEGTTLTPMVLYAYYRDASEANVQVPAAAETEDIPEAVAEETVREEPTEAEPEAAPVADDTAPADAGESDPLESSDNDNGGTA